MTGTRQRSKIPDWFSCFLATPAYVTAMFTCKCWQRTLCTQASFLVLFFFPRTTGAAAAADVSTIWMVLQGTEQGAPLPLQKSSNVSQKRRLCLSSHDTEFGFQIWSNYNQTISCLQVVFKSYFGKFSEAFDFEKLNQFSNAYAPCGARTVKDDFSLTDAAVDTGFSVTRVLNAIVLKDVAQQQPFE